MSGVTNVDVRQPRRSANVQSFRHLETPGLGHREPRRDRGSLDGSAPMRLLIKDHRTLGLWQLDYRVVE